MSATTERRRSRGFVAETLRQPIEDAVREGVKDALEEQAATTRERSSDRSDEGGESGRGTFAMIALLGLGVAALLLWRRRSGGSGGAGGTGGPAESIRSRSKTGPKGASEATSTGAETSDLGAGEGAVETTEESIEAEDATPEAGNE